ncbi:DUF676-domain-containing protein [Xylariaceae sp. FL0016]|nr:DUF676-domain-containing protein [Xylariaceae sp. FL0016]
MEFNGGSLSADHLVVLVHGLWGNPEHMKSVAKALRTEHSADKVHILVAKRNSSSFTYDGIERGGERVCVEIEEELEKIKKDGGNITKISLVGYSLGGLVSRYAIGLLYAKGIFDQLEPINFTTFASPHLGVRAPLRGWYDHVWNTLGARTLSKSGHQLFTIDDFRDTGRPLLAILADPDSIFITGLKKFKRRTLYSNVVNDRSAVYYTTCITKTDPYTDMTRVKPNYIKGYEDVILDPANPVSLTAPKAPPQTISDYAETGVTWLKNAPLVVGLAVMLPIGITAFLMNAVVQTSRSTQRIKLHDVGGAGIEVEQYRMPIWIKELRGKVEDVYENINSSQKQSYLGSSSDDESGDDEETQIMALERRQSHPQWPTLALSPHQFSMITALDNVGWRKYPVWIHNARHSHAAIIVRMDVKRFDEGHVVLKHWLKEEFLI